MLVNASLRQWLDDFGSNHQSIALMTLLLWLCLLSVVPVWLGRLTSGKR